MKHGSILGTPEQSGMYPQPRGRRITMMMGSSGPSADHASFWETLAGQPSGSFRGIHGGVPIFELPSINSSPETIDREALVRAAESSDPMLMGTYQGIPALPYEEPVGALPWLERIWATGWAAFWMTVGGVTFWAFLRW